MPPASTPAPTSTSTTRPVLDRRALNRALLARQLLLDRPAMPALDAIEHLVGLQGQEPLEPYVGLWSRLAGFQPPELVGLLESRRAVRTVLMRRTIHLVSARDAVAFRPVHQKMLETRSLGTLRRVLPGVDPVELAVAGRPYFEERPRTVSEVGREVGHRWPDALARNLGDALSCLVPLVQVPPRGIWGRNGPARNTTIEAWLGPSPDPPPSPDDVLDEIVLRYLSAFGPAAVADIRAWSGLTGLRAPVERLRPRLRTFRDERCRELFDVEGGVLPDPDVPAPPRFLPAFDNAVLGFDDRTRIIDDAHRGLSVQGARVLLFDGRVAATWTVLADNEDSRTLLIELLGSRGLGRDDRRAVRAEGDRLLTFLTDGRGGRVVING